MSISMLQVQHAPGEVGSNYLGWATVACDGGVAKRGGKMSVYSTDMLDVSKKALIFKFSKSDVQMC